MAPCKGGAINIWLKKNNANKKKIISKIMNHYVLINADTKLNSEAHFVLSSIKYSETKHNTFCISLRIN